MMRRRSTSNPAAALRPENSALDNTARKATSG
jgi:hypothetical protein